jgi:hypothetical protein
MPASLQRKSFFINLVLLILSCSGMGVSGLAHAGGATVKLIDGVMYTTAGLTSAAGFRQREYEYVQP